MWSWLAIHLLDLLHLARFKCPAIFSIIAYHCDGQTNVISAGHTQYKGSQHAVVASNIVVSQSGATGRVASGNGRIATCCTFSACLAYFCNHSRDRDSSYRCTRSDDINSKFLPIALHATIFNDMLQFLSFPGFDFVCCAVCRHVQHVAAGFQWLFLFASCLINCLAKAKR